MLEEVQGRSAVAEAGIFQAYQFFSQTFSHTVSEELFSGGETKFNSSNMTWPLFLEVSRYRPDMGREWPHFCHSVMLSGVWAILDILSLCSRRLFAPGRPKRK